MRRKKSSVFGKKISLEFELLIIFQKSKKNEVFDTAEVKHCENQSCARIF